MKEINRIVCLTEESVEFLYRIGRSELICGVSTYAVRPQEVKKKKVVSTFTHSNLKKIKELNPDLVIGFSDIQKDIAKDLIDMGLNVFISNQRSIDEILLYLKTLGYMIGEFEKTNEVINELKLKIESIKERAKEINYSPKVYIEEWDNPRITGIKWFGELVEICGGQNIFKDLSDSSIKAQERFVSEELILHHNPDIILACWCGKKVDFNEFKNNEILSKTNAVLNSQIFELPPEIFLQPGIAPIIDGLDILLDIFSQVKKSI